MATASWAANFDAQVTVSSKSLAACADGSLGLFRGNAGIGYVRGGGLKTWLTGGVCDLGPYRIMASQAGVARAHAAPTDSFTVARGQRQVNLEFGGAGGAPEVILRGPHGVVVGTPATGSLATTRNSAVLVDRANAATSTALYKPAPGRWAITAAPGSPAIDREQRADSLPAPAVRAS